MKDITEIIKFILSAILIAAIGFGLLYLNNKYNGLTVGEVVKSIYLDFMENGEKDLPFEDHPNIEAPKITDYQWAMDYVRKQNIILTETETEVIEGINDGKLEYVCRGIDEIGASDVITPYYFVYGNGSVYVISIPLTASLDVSPISLIVINADTVKAEHRGKMLTKCNNIFSVTLYCGIENAFKYDLYSKLS